MIDKLQAFIGEPRAFYLNALFQQMFILVADVCVVHRPGSR